MENLNPKILFIQECLTQGQHDVAVKECGTLFEVSLRELFRTAIATLPFARRTVIVEKEREIGKGVKGIDSFGFGELVGLLRESLLVKDWGAICGQQPGLVEGMNLTSIVALRNQITHKGGLCTRHEAELVLWSLKTFLSAAGHLVAEKPPLSEEQSNVDPVTFIDKHQASEIFRARLRDPAIQVIQIVTYTNEVEAGAMTRYAVRGSKTIEIYKRSIVSDLRDQQAANIQRLLAGKETSWKKYRRSLKATISVEEEFSDSKEVSVKHYFYDGPPTKRAFVFDGKEAVLSYYETYEDSLSTPGSSYKGMEEALRIHVTDETTHGRFVLEELRHFVASVRATGRTWRNESRMLDSPGSGGAVVSLPCFNPAAVLLDLDGVLYDSMPLYVEAWQSAFRQIGVEIPEELVYQHEGRSANDTVRLIMSKVARRAASDDEMDQVIGRKRAILDKSEVPVMPGAVELLRAIARTKTPRFIVTSSTRTGLKADLARDFGGLVPEDCIVCGGDVAVGKPDPEPYLSACRRAGVDPWCAVSIENAPLGVESASRAGTYCIAVATGKIGADELKACGARNVVDSCARLSEMWPGIVEMLSRDKA